MRKLLWASEHPVTNDPPIFGGSASVKLDPTELLQYVHNITNILQLHTNKKTYLKVSGVRVVLKQSSKNVMIQICAR